MRILMQWWVDGTRKSWHALMLSIAIAAFVLGLPNVSIADPDQSDPLFEGWKELGESELADNSGGTQLNLGDLGLNIASNKAEVNGNTVSGTVTTGQINNNTLSDVNGINSLMFNTGNNVNFQSNMQINIFLK